MGNDPGFMYPPEAPPEDWEWCDFHNESSEYCECDMDEYGNLIHPTTEAN